MIIKYRRCNMKKNRGFSLAWVLVIVSITSIISALTTGVIIYNNNKVSSNLTYSDLSKDEALNQFLEVYASISEEYYEDINKEAMLDKAIAAMMDYLGDDYTDYLDDDTTAELMNKLKGTYTGIGVSIDTKTKAINEVFEDSPAAKAGIMVGDIIIGINDTNVESLSSSEVVALIKKETGTYKLTLKRNNESVVVSLKNEELIYRNITYKIIDNTNIGYLYIDTFSATLETQVASALKTLEQEGITSLIIDVRDNTGGYLDAAVSVASMFTKKGDRLYSLKDKENITNYNDKTEEYREYPIVILINNNTASASEILTGALHQSYGATIVGETSYGKGKVQQTMPLEDGGMVKYTSAYWLMPDGTCIDGVGIKPDYVISNETINIDEENGIMAEKDSQLEKAIDILRGE